MLQIGPQELLLILVLALVVVGPRRLPEIGRSIGKGIRELRRAQDEVRRTIQVNLDEEPDGDAGGSRRLPESDGPSSPSTGEPAAPAATSDVSEVSRTIGRGLAELRRAREEIQRSFRVTLDDAQTGRGPTPPAGPAEAEPPPDGTERTSTE